MNLSGRKILVTGGVGLIGSTIINQYWLPIRRCTWSVG